MPLYEYRCESCGQRAEVLQRFGDPPLETCAECGGPMRKLVSSPAFQFKGSGWYVTDYARAGEPGQKGESAERAKDAKDGGGDQAESATKSDTAAAGDKKESASKAEGAAKPSPAAPATSGGAKE